MPRGAHYHKRVHGARKMAIACAVLGVVIVGAGLAWYSLENDAARQIAAREQPSSQSKEQLASQEVASSSKTASTEAADGSFSKTGAKSISSAKKKAAMVGSSVSSMRSSGSSSGSEPGVDARAVEGDSRKQAIQVARARLDLTKDFRGVFYHGKKPAKYQKYIVLHDTEGDSSPESVVSWWAGNGNLVAAHFVVGKDGHIVQCVPLSRIAHHAGYGDTGHDKEFGVTEDGRDDMAGSTPIGGSYADYGMNAWSIGIEMVHVGGEGSYPGAQLEAVDNLIAYLDAYYGGDAGEIVDHKMWRSSNSDTSMEFANYLKNYQKKRKHA